jgi:hypothetical protein
VGSRGAALIAERLDVSEAEVEDMDMRLRESDLSLNMPARRDEPGAEIGDLSDRRRASAEENDADTGAQAAFFREGAEFAKTLDERDRILVDRRSSPTSQDARGARRGIRRVARARAPARGAHRGASARVPKDNLVDFEYYAAPSDELTPEGGAGVIVRGRVQGVAYPGLHADEAHRAGSQAGCANRPDGSVEGRVRGCAPVAGEAAAQGSCAAVRASARVDGSR